MTDQSVGQSPGRDFPIGTVIAGYRLEERIGAGGMAVVFRAHDARLDRQVALKLLAPGLDLDDGFRQRFMLESRAAAAVDDPHIIPVFEAGEAQGVLFLAMRYVPGRDLRTLINRTGSLPVGRVASIVSQVAAALDAAHARGLVHRDVKPANMLLEAREAGNLPDHVYLSDFGLTKASLGTSLALTDSGEFLGTLEYVSPEQISGGVLDGRSDEYSLACSAFEMLCGQPPFRREQSVSVMYAHLHEPPPPISLFRRGLPAGIDSVLGRALAKAPADRYRSCGEFASALRQVLDDKPARQVEAPASQGQRPASQGQRLASQGLRPADHPATEPVLQAASAATQPPRRPDATTHRFTRLVPPAYPRRARRRQWWLSPAPVAGLLALVLAGGGYLLATHRPAGAVAGGHRAGRPAGLRVPGCTHATAPAPALTPVRPANIRIPGAFGVATTGRYAFVSGGGAVTILQAGSTAGTLTVRRTISVPGANKGDALTHDGQYLLAARGSGAAVISVPNALAGAPAVVGTLTSSTGGTGAAQVVLSPNDDYAFVTLQDSDKLAVYNLQKALGSHFATSGFVGDIRVGQGPQGLAASGGSLYVANTRYLSVVSMSRAERGQAAAVVANVQAGCHGPARAQVSADGKMLWVTTPGSDALLGFSTALLGNGAANPLVARVRVGEQPLGLALDPAPGSTRIVVADSDQGNLPGKRPSLAIVDSVHGSPATVLGYIGTGGLPRQAAFMPDGRTLLVTNAGRVQVYDLGLLN